MISKRSIVNGIIKEFTVNGVSKYSKKKLSEIIHQRHPDLFNTTETARSHIRDLTGANGAGRLIKKELKIKWKGFNLPEPEKNDYSKVIVNEKRIGILSDIHFPYYDKAALNAAISFLIEWQPDCIILNGDIIDCYQLSFFIRDKRQRSFKYELDMLASFFVQLRQLFPKQRIIFKMGNHSERYEKQILANVPELIELELFTFENVIDAKKYNIEVVKNKRIIKIGQKLNVLHGHETTGGISAPVNPARGLFLRTKASTIAGHNHQTSEHIESDLNGNIIGCWSTGCLCELNPHYMPINKWNHGFCTVENHDVDFTVRNMKIIKGRIL